MKCLPLDELQAKGLPHPTVDYLSSLLPELDEEQTRKANEYLSGFARTDRICPGCGSSLHAFTWGIVSGEGECGDCGYPMRAFHRFDGVKWIVNAVLPYHPDTLVVVD